MTTKPNAKPAAAKKAPAKKAAAAPKPESKKAAAKVAAPIEPEVPAVDQEELEEQEEASTAAASASNGNAAALAAANGSGEMSASFKNFRHHPDMENFYRFIFENDLRHEALAIIDAMIADKTQKKLIKGAKTPGH